MNYKINDENRKLIFALIVALYVSVIATVALLGALIDARSIITQLKIECKEEAVECVSDGYSNNIIAENIEKQINEEVVEIDSSDVEVEVESESIHEYFNVPLDEKLQNYIFEECERYGVDSAVIFAMIERESNFIIDAIGDNGNSFGLMQIQPKWNSDRMEKLECNDLLDPYQNVTVGIDLMGELLDKEKGLEWSLMSYNGGSSYANRMTNEGRVSDYAIWVIQRSEELRKERTN